MATLIENLQTFNRKERFVVIQTVHGNESDFVSLSEAFRKKIHNSLGGDPPIPSSVFLATDYHLDWIEVALVRTADSKISLSTPFESPSPRINTNQQDIDLLVAFNSLVNGGSLTDLVLIEAKAYTGWNNEQLRSKVERLQEIFGDGSGRKYRSIVRPWLVLMSPKESNRIEHDYWPTWMKPYGGPQWLIYNLPDREKITRCTKDGTWSKDGKFLVIDPISIGKN